jgi:hypothetical protein
VTLTPGHLPEEQQQILRAVALAYRRVMRASVGAAATRAEILRRDQKRQSEALAAATAEYRRLSPAARYDQLAVSGEVNRIIAAAINVDPHGFGMGRRRDALPYRRKSPGNQQRGSMSSGPFWGTVAATARDRDGGAVISSSK